MRKPLAERLYHLLLRLFPSEFRGDFGDEMSSVFRDERAEAATSGRSGLTRLWWRTLGGFARIAPREHAHVLIRDAGYGLRLMRRNPLTTGAAVLAIALGVGANTAMFTVVNAVLLQLPFEDPDRLVSVRRLQARGNYAPISMQQFRAWSAGVDAFDSLAGYSMASPVWTGDGAPDRVRLECFSAAMFPTLGVAPAMGRTFTEDEDTPAGAQVVVVSHAFWTNRLGADRGSIGRALILDGAPVTVIGVMPRQFDGPRALRRIDGWIPLTSCLTGERMARSLIGQRLRSTEAGRRCQCRRERRWTPCSTRRDPPAARSHVRLESLTEEITGEVRQPLLALSGAAGFVLLIACANVASLLLGRADARRRELSLRAALGCSRARMIRQLLTESVLFALCGGVAGLLMANWSLGALLSVMPGYIRRIDHIALDGRVLVMCVALSTATGFVFGLLPAVYASRVDLGATLKESALAATPSRRRMRGALIVAEVALSMALLIGASLLVKTFLHLRPVDPGFDPEGKVATTISLPASRYADGPTRTAFVEHLQQRLLQRPGVQAVAATSYLPLSGFISTADVQREDGDRSAPTELYAPHVTPEYFSVMGMTILRGRAFTPADGPGSGVAIVNETLAQRMWPGQDPLGRRITFKGQGTASTKTIVGISRNVRDSGRRLSAAAEVYVPFADEPVPILRVVVRTAERQEQISRTIREEVAAIDPILPIGDVESVAAITARSVATWRFAASLMSAFAVIALALAAVGLFAVVNCWVTERTPEIGVRMALGAGRGRVLRLFLARGAALAALGLICGVSLAALTTRFLSGWLVDTSPLDWASFLAAAAAMAIVCMLATLLAARRAAGVDPLTALRS